MKFYFTGHHTLKQETCDSVVTETCRDTWDGSAAVLWDRCDGLIKYRRSH